MKKYLKSIKLHNLLLKNIINICKIIKIMKYLLKSNLTLILINSNSKALVISNNTIHNNKCLHLKYQTNKFSCNNNNIKISITKINFHNHINK